LGFEFNHKDHSDQHSQEFLPYQEELLTRYANPDGASLIAERLHPEVLTWLEYFFFCQRGCQSGELFRILAPIIDALIDLLWLKFSKKGKLSHVSQRRFEKALFVAGLAIPSTQIGIDEEPWTLMDLLSFLARFNPTLSSDELPFLNLDTLKSPWPTEFMHQIQMAWPTLRLTIHALRRMADKNPVIGTPKSEDEFQANAFHEMMRQKMGLEPETKTHPAASSRLFLLAGAIAGGVIPGSPTHPFPLICEETVVTEEQDSMPDHHEEESVDF
jgi:hypothetical protein